MEAAVQHYAAFSVIRCRAETGKLPFFFGGKWNNSLAIDGGCHYNIKCSNMQKYYVFC